MSAQDLSDLLKARMLKLHLNNSEIAHRANISRQTWYRLLNAEIEDAKLSTLMRIAAALDVHTLTLLKIYFRGSNLPEFDLGVSGKSGTQTGFIADITYPDNALVFVGEEFEKVWEVINLGDKPWQGWRLICVDGRLAVSSKPEHEAYSRKNNTQLGLQPLVDEIPIPTTLPGEHVQLRVWFRAPDYPCTVISHWKSVNEQGELVFPHMTGLYCQVKVLAAQNHWRPTPI